MPKRESIQDSWKGVGGSVRGENVVNSAMIRVTNRQQKAKDSLGWRQLADGTKTYSTYRGGTLKTLTGGEAFNAFMADNKGKGVAKGAKGAKGKQNDKHESSNNGNDKTGKKRKSSDDDQQHSKTAKGSSTTSSSSTVMHLSAPAPTYISPKAYVPSQSSDKGGEGSETDWGF